MSFPILEKRSEVKSVLVIHQGALGDFILALPALKILRKVFPQAKSVIMGYPRILELVDQRFYAEEISSIDQRGMASFFVQGGSLDRPLSQFLSTFDLVVYFGRDAEGIMIGNLGRVSRAPILPVNSFPPWDSKVHVTDHLLGQFAHYGLPVSELNPKLYLKESDRDWGRHFWSERGLTLKERLEVIVLHPGSGSKRKVWPLERFLNLVLRLQNRNGSKILVVLGPAEGFEVQSAFEGMRGNGLILARGLSLIQLASVMEGCRFFIGNDSGISHMAAALGLPTIAIFGPTDPRVWSPRGEKVFVVRREMPCSPCPQERLFQCRDFECLTGIETGEVLRGLERMGEEPI